MAKAYTQFKQLFFERVPPIMVVDPLASNLDAVDADIPLVYAYTDAVKLAGHSCLAVSGGYRMTQIALAYLYKDQTAVRGEIEVVFQGAVDYKVNGPISQVVTFITGAAGENGFKGFGDGRFNRHKLMTFDTLHPPPPDVVCAAQFTRIDNRYSVRIRYSNHMLPKDVPLQERVRMVLLEDMEHMFEVAYTG